MGTKSMAEFANCPDVVLRRALAPVGAVAMACIALMSAWRASPAAG